MRRGQTSFEAIALFATATIILTIFMMSYGSQVSTRAELREFEALSEVAEMLRAEIELARQAGPGYVRTVTLPETSGSKNVILTVRYPETGDAPSELTVSFYPPIADSLEASRVLGPGVYGTFSGGTNRIYTYRGGIIVEPDPEVMEELLDDGLIEEHETEAAFAHIEGPTVRFADRIECEYGISNSYAAHVSNKWVFVGWIGSDPDGDITCEEHKIEPGTRTYLRDAIPDLDDIAYEAYRKGSNLSCVIQYVEAAGGSPQSSVCGSGGGGAQSDARIAVSENVTIVNSLPDVADTFRSIPEAEDDDEERQSVWDDIEVTFSVEDADPDDMSFNITLIKDGTNARYIECETCSWNEVDEGEYVAVFDLTIPWPEGTDECTSLINRLSFRIAAVESDATGPLQTLHYVDLSGQICEGGDFVGGTQMHGLTVSATAGGSVNVDWGTDSAVVAGPDSREFFFVENTNVDLTADPDAGWLFDSWLGGLSGTDPSGSVTMDSQKQVSASFVEEYMLEVTVDAGGSVTVDWATGSEIVTGPAVREFPFEDGTTVNLIADATSGYQFDSWSGALSGSDPSQSLTMDSQKQVSASFRGEHTLEVFVEGDNSVSVGGAVSDTFAGPGSKSYVLLDGDVVDLTASSSSGWVFDRWSGALTGSSSSGSITMDSDKSVTAHFLETFNLRLNVNGQGSVEVDDATTVTGTQTFTYVDGDSVKLEAINTRSNWRFDGWSGDLTGTTTPRTFTISGPMSVQANFEEVPSTYSAWTKIHYIWGVKQKSYSGSLYSGQSRNHKDTVSYWWWGSHSCTVTLRVSNSNGAISCTVSGDNSACGYERGCSKTN